MLVRDMEKLTLGNDDVLYRHTTDKKNWFPPKKKTDNTSFHRATGHLGQDCTLQLVKDQFYQPKMEDDVRHFAVLKAKSLQLC